VERKFEEYRTAIKENHQVDIKNFKDRTKGGFADGKPLPTMIWDNCSKG